MVSLRGVARQIAQIGLLTGFVRLGQQADGLREISACMCADRRDQFLAHAEGGPELEFSRLASSNTRSRLLRSRKAASPWRRWCRALFPDRGVELTAWATSPSARSSSTERASSVVRASSSLNRRTFSIAMTAWSAKCGHQLDLLVGERPYLADGRCTIDADQLVLLQHRHGQKGAYAAILANATSGRDRQNTRDLR